MATRSLETIVFPGGFNLPLWAGLAQGCFEAEGLDLNLHYTANSVEQMSGLIHGKYEIGMTGADNVIAYQEGQGEAELTVTPDLFIFMGGDNAFLQLVVQGDIASYEDLRGRTLSVDAMTTGFAFVLRAMLENAGIAESEVSFERAGGVLQRFEAMKEGKHAGTLLLTPFDLIGEKLGMRVLQSATEVFPSYQGVIGTTRRGWAAENGAALTGYIAAYRAALKWLYDPANRDAACAILCERVPNMQPALAEATCARLLAEPGGFEPEATLDRPGLVTVLELRSRYGQPQKTLTDPDRYVDLTWYDAARAREQA